MVSIFKTNMLRILYEDFLEGDYVNPR